MLLATLPTGAASAGAPEPTPAPRDSVTNVAPGVYRVGGVTIDANQRVVTVRGRVNMRSGPVELLACTPDGKTHESVFVVDAEPHHVQVGLLLLGLEPSRRPLRHQGDRWTPTGDSVEVVTSWRDSSDSTVSMRAEETVWDHRLRRAMPPTPWIFVGSRVVNGVFEAGIEGNLIATFHDPATIIDHPLQTGADDTVYGANSHVLPPVGTPIEIRIRPYRMTADEREP